MHGPIIGIDRPRRIVCLSYRPGIDRHWRVDDDGRMLRAMPERDHRSCVAVLPAPVDCAELVAARWRGDPYAVWLADAWYQGRRIRGIIIDRCEVSIDGGVVDIYAMNPLMRQSRDIVWVSAPVAVEPTEDDERQLEGVFEEIGRMNATDNRG